MSYNRLLAYVNRCYEKMGYIPSENEIETELGWCLTFADYDRFERELPSFISINDMTGIDIHYNIGGLKNGEKIKSGALSANTMQSIYS